MIKEIIKTCPICGTKSTVRIPLDAYNKWTEGELIQHAWPEGSATDREILISGLCKDCQDEVF